MNHILWRRTATLMLWCDGIPLFFLHSSALFSDTSRLNKMYGVFVWSTEILLNGSVSVGWRTAHRGHILKHQIHIKRDDRKWSSHLVWFHFVMYAFGMTMILPLIRNGNMQTNKEKWEKWFTDFPNNNTAHTHTHHFNIYIMTESLILKCTPMENKSKHSILFNRFIVDLFICKWKNSI